jgi:ATP-dependent Lhr-like helicase
MHDSAIFHPAVATWLRDSFAAPTPAQERAWPAILAGEDTLIAAPTGSGKTLAAFLAAIDELVREGLASPLPDATRVIYVSPLKALSNDIRLNLQTPLEGVRARLLALGYSDVELRAMVRTGDTATSERNQMRRRPPQILVTTPESLYILLGSQSGRTMLGTATTVIVDEIHALAGNKRGAHLALSLARLDALAGRRLRRVGLSATQQPIAAAARFLTGAAADGGPLPCTIVDAGHSRARDLALELPQTPLEAVLSGDGWTQIYDRIALLARAHRSTLVFVNTRRMAERVARHLAERLGEPQVRAHHGSLAREQRFDAEQRLKRGELKALVATGSLELGIDIGDVDLVCQVGAPRGINSFLQRAGRAGHAVGGIAKARLFPLSRDELVEAAALFDSIRRGELDRLELPAGPLDVLCQQIAAEVAARDWRIDELYSLVRGAWTYRQLERAQFDELLHMLGEGFSGRSGRRHALLHLDEGAGEVRPQRGVRLTALTSGGAIPDTADYRVTLEPESIFIGSVNEDFAVESLAGDVFQLGNHSYRILRVERGNVRVEDAHGMPPSIPFWLGEAPGRSDALSHAVARLRADLLELLALPDGTSAARVYLLDTLQLGGDATAQLLQYLGAARSALGTLPTQSRVIFERFFDESGGMQLVIHTPFGSRINRAWGLALRKRFCRKFNFELQAAATEDCIVLSLTAAHSFELGDVAHYLHSTSARAILVQALLAAPMFTARWRWVASISLALPRFRGGQKVAPQLVRMNAEDLLAAIFPDQVACGENLTGDIEVPDHPLVRQTLHDCLHEAMDADGFEALLRGIESGRIEVLARDVTEPSPLALEVLGARPYAFLDDAPLEERRTQAVLARRWLDPQSAADIGKLDSAAIARVREEAWPDAGSTDELHDALLWLGYLTDDEARRTPDWPVLLARLEAGGRVQRRLRGGTQLWVATARQDLFARALAPQPDPAAVLEVVRGRLEGVGPVSVAELAAPLDVAEAVLTPALLALESEGSVLRGHFEAQAGEQWCERRLLARVHRYTVKRLRAEIEPVPARDFLRFLCDWQHVTPSTRVTGPDAVAATLLQLEGYEAPAAAWEGELLPGRIDSYDPAWLDAQGLAGRFVWRRLAPRSDESARSGGPVRATPIVLLSRRNAGRWSALTSRPAQGVLSAAGQGVLEHLRQHGASFFDDLVEGAHLLPSQVEDALGELVAHGLATSDSFAGLRTLLLPGSGAAAGHTAARRRRRAAFGMSEAGRWSPAGAPVAPPPPQELVEEVARALLRRWGVVFWRLLEREAAWLPPWRELLVCLRRLEARGEIRGGRFVAGFPGEQFAVPEALGSLRELRRRPHDGHAIAISAADPLNLVGILTPGARLPSLTGNRCVFRDGIACAVLAGGEVRLLEPQPDAAAEWELRQQLLRRGPRSAASAQPPERLA